MPSKQPQFYNPYRKIVVATLCVLALVALIGIGLLSIELFNGSKFLGAILLAGVFLVGSLAVFLQRVSGKRIEGYIAAIRNGQYLVRWSYTPDEWHSYCNAVDRRVAWEFIAFVFVAVTGLVVALVSLLFKILGPDQPATIKFDSRDSGVVLGALFALVFGTMSWIMFSARKRRRSYWENPPDTYVARDFAHVGGEFWQLEGMRIQDVKCLPGTPMLIELVIIQVRHNPNTGLSTDTTTKQYLPVPAGCEAQAEPVAEAIRKAKNIAGTQPCSPK